MRFDRIRLSHFGGLHHMDTGDENLGRLVIVHGPNESGKSTFFHFLTSMLYGFRPANSGQHPYAPWSGDEIEGEALGHLDDGGPWSVIRRLRSSPWGRLVTEDGEVELRNRTLPFVDHVPRSVFQKVFALTLHELGALDGETWTTLQDRLLARMVQDDLRAPRDVVAELRSEANALWRPDQRGRPRSRTITTEILDLQRERRVARERDQDLRRASEALRKARKELDTVRVTRRDEASMLDRIERLLPARRLLARLQRLDSEVEPARLEGLPQDPVGTLDRLRGELRRSTDASVALAAEIDRVRGRMPEPEPGDSELLRDRDTIDSRTEEFEAMRDQRTRLESATGELRGLERRAGVVAGELFGSAETVAYADSLAKAPLGSLADETNRYRSAREERRAKEESLGLDVGGVASPSVERIGFVSAIGGIVLVAVGAAFQAGTATTLGLVLVGVAALALILRWDRGRRDGGGPTAADVERTRATEEASLERIRAILSDLPLRPELLSDPRPEVVTRLELLREQLREVHERLGDVREREARLRALESDVRGILERAALSTDSPTPERTLLRSLANAAERERARQGALGELARLEARRPALTQEEQAVGNALAELEGRLAPLADGDPVRGAEQADRKLQIARRIDETVRELLDAYDSRDGVEEELTRFEAETERTIDDDGLESCRQALAAAQERELRLSEMVTGLERDVLHLEKERTVSVLDGEIEALKDERQEVQRDRDRLALLGSIIEEADRRFRDKHQPDVVRRSGEYLSWITDTRYQRLVAGEDEGGGHLMLQTGGGRSIDVNGPLSTGTKEQVLLSLRLAVADHLDSTGERMPLFIDEAFVNWDDGRQDRGLELVKELSKSRQVFVFTCHGRLAQVLAEGGARLVQLDRMAG